MDIKKFAEKIAELHYPNKPNAIIDEPYRKVRMNTLIQQIESEFEIINKHIVSNNEVVVCTCLEPEPHGRYTVMRNYCCKCNKRLAN